MAELLELHGYPILFLIVFAEQVGVPIPAVPAMMLAGALAVEERMAFPDVFAVAVSASILGDAVCFILGRKYGWRLMRVLCGVSLTPDSCVRETSSQFERWGGWTLVFGKFIPGVGTIAPPLAGISGMSWPRFVILTSIGSVLWVGMGVGIGAVFHTQVAEALEIVDRLGARAALAAIALIVLYAIYKWWRRKRFITALRMARITVDELRSLFDLEVNPLVVDLRTRGDRARAGAIPGARAVDLPDLTTHLADFPKDREIVFYCSCPSEASAASAAKTLMDLGYERVRPLAGGFEAWVAAGYKVATSALETTPNAPGRGKA